ncbi:unnamed protein product, partial [Owenia fusiformis]
GDGVKTCLDIDECSEGTDNCTGLHVSGCSNLPGSFTCTCKHSLVWNSVLAECIDSFFNSSTIDPFSTNESDHIAKSETSTKSEIELNSDGMTDGVTATLTLVNSTSHPPIQENTSNRNISKQCMEDMTCIAIVVSVIILLLLASVIIICLGVCFYKHKHTQNLRNPWTDNNKITNERYIMTSSSLKNGSASTISRTGRERIVMSSPRKDAYKHVASSSSSSSSCSADYLYSNGFQWQNVNTPHLKVNDNDREVVK